MKPLIIAAILVSAPAAAQEAPVAQTLETPRLQFLSPSSDIRFHVASCGFATVNTATKEVSINWKCVDEYVAKPDEPFGYNNNFRAWAIMLKAVHEGTYKDVTP